MLNKNNKLRTRDNSPITINKGDNNVFNISPIYNKTIVTNIINSIPPKSDFGDYRDALNSIETSTRTKFHIFSRFVNHMNKEKVVICNLFWNKNVYITSHINIFEFPENIEIGDFIVFKGQIYPYDRKNGTEDKGIKILEIIKTIKSEKTINIYDEEQCELDLDFINNLNWEDLEHFYYIQMNRIRSGIESNKYLYPEMFESILQTVYYEGTKEYDMVKDMLVLPQDKLNPDICKWICFIRYLICDIEIQSPFIVYTILCNVMKRKDSNKLNDKFDKNVRRYSIENICKYNIDLKLLMKEYFNRLGFYIKEYRILIGDLIDDEENE